MTIKFENLAQAMLEKCAEHALPLHYGTDVAQDLAVIMQCDATKFVWLIRESGSQILPVGKGVNPIHIEYYLRNFSTRMTYLIDYSTGTFTQINDEKAKELSNALPAFVRSTPQAAIQRAEEVLTEGINARWWGALQPPKSINDQKGIKGWLNYFVHDENAPMIAFLRKAIAASQSSHAKA